MTPSPLLPRRRSRWGAIISLLFVSLWVAPHARAQNDMRPAGALVTQNDKVISSPSSNAVSDERPMQTSASKDAREEEDLSQYQASHAQLLEHFLGATSKAIRFDWRNSVVMLGAYASEMIERNNFASYRSGILVRKAAGDAVVELNLSGVTTLPTPSSDLLSLTPYQQSGRPSRFELELNGGYPLAEGVMTPAWSWLSPAQLVWMAYGGFRYALYPTILGSHWQQAWQPSLSDDERSALAPMTLPGMHVDGARFQIMAGSSLDVYFVPGIFITPRAMMAIPVGIDFLTGSDLGFWWEWGIAFGYAF